MQVTIYRDLSVFDQLSDEWNALLHQSPTNTIFLTQQWQVTWWRAYNAGDLFVHVVRADDGRLLGVGPWFIEHLPDERVVRTIGCVDVTDYVDVLTTIDAIDEVYRALAQSLWDTQAEFDRVNLCNIPEASPTLAGLAEALRQVGFESTAEFQEVCPVITLPDSWEAYLESLDKKQRHELRRKLRRSDGDDDQITWYTVEAGDAALLPAIETFLSLMRSSHPDKALFLDNPKNEQFFRLSLPVLHRCGWLRLSFLEVNNVPSAVYCDFDYGNNILVYNSGLLPEVNATLSAGIILLAHNIRAAIENGKRSFDFLRGNEIYKYRMGGVDTKVFKLKASAPRN